MAITRQVTGQYELNGVRVESWTIDSVWVTFPEPRTETTYVGRVIKVYNDNYRAMSDIWTLATFAEVLGDDLKIQRVLVNANFECDIGGGKAEVDATEATLAIKRLRDIEQHNANEKARIAEMERRAEAERNRPVKGKTMKVVRGRKVPVGTVGVVAYIKDNSVLIKDPACWQDREAQGQWVPAAYLVAV